MKNFFSTLLILGFFYWIAVATSYQKDLDYPCYYQVADYVYSDTLVRAYYERLQNDTIIIRAYKDSLWEIKTAQICKIMKDSCALSAYKILVVDTSQNYSTWNTQYGKKIYFRQCP